MDEKAKRHICEIAGIAVFVGLAFSSRVLSKMDMSLPLPAAISYEVAVQQPIFSDIPRGHPLFAATKHLSETGVISGRPDGSFGPEDTINRAEIAKMFVVISDLQVGNFPSYDVFYDLEEDAWYEAFVKIAAYNELITGYSDGSFQPERGVTRAEFLAVAQRAYNLEVNTGHNFSDVRDAWIHRIAGIAEDYDLFLDDEQELQPHRYMSRGDVARALYAIQ